MQKKVRSFWERQNLGGSPEVCDTDLVSEVGELGKELLKRTDYGRHPPTEGSAVQEEIGDYLFSLLALCCALNLARRGAPAAALRKYERRMEEQGNIGSGQ